MSKKGLQNPMSSSKILMSSRVSIRPTWSHTSLLRVRTHRVKLPSGHLRRDRSLSVPVSLGTLGIPLTQINVIGTTMGGGFGGRFGVIITHIPAVLLSKKTGRPVRVQMTREEEFTDGRPAPDALSNSRPVLRKTDTSLHGRHSPSGIPALFLVRLSAVQSGSAGSIRFRTSK